MSVGTTATLTYDYEDRLTHLEGLGVSQSYTYNGADARVGKSGTGGNRTYRRDGVGVTAPVLSDGQATMVPGISEKVNAGGNRFSHLDRLGTNAKTTDTSDNVIDSRSYDAFGVPVSVSNPSNSERGFASAFGYQEDGESGLKLLGHRYYVPGTGRFLTRDPAQDGTSWYAYCDNNPLSDVDPTGLKAQDIREYDKANGTNYTDQFRARIKSLRNNGEAKAAQQLDDMLNNGEIMVDPDPNDFVGHYPVSTEHPQGGTYKPSAFTNDDGITLSPDLFANTSYRTKFLESTLLHEEVHWYGRHHGMPRNEYLSTEAEIAYARRRARRKMPDGSEGDWNGIARGARKYQKGFVGRDIPKIIPIIFGGFL